MQPINILSDQPTKLPRLLHPHQRMVGAVGLCCQKRWITQLTARPVALAPSMARQKILVAYWLWPLPIPCSVSVITDTRYSANAGSGDDQQIVLSQNKPLQAF
jgi:hypothetical protein